MDEERIVYVNGAYVTADAAKISVFDRGFLFADGVYEVTSVLDGRLVDFDGHFERLKRSLSEIEIGLPIERDPLLEVHRTLVSRNQMTEGMIYLQITRGAPGVRDFVFPPEDTPATLVLFSQDMTLTTSPKAEKGIKVIAIPDERWARRDIKTVQLLYPSIGKNLAARSGADDAWMVEDGAVTEGTSNNAYIVTADGRIVTRQLSNHILHGITRKAVLRLAEEVQMVVEERPFTIEEAQGAAEAFITSATTFVTPVVSVDGAEIGDGKPGSVARRLREIYIEESLKTAI